MKKKLKNTCVNSPVVRWGGVTDVGKVREENQDAYFADPESGLFLVSDGMGGHQAGALASKVVAEVLPVMIKDEMAKLRSYGTTAIKSVLNKTIIELSRRMRIESSNKTGIRGMGATLVMTLIRENCCFVANMGDSRAYLFRQGKLRQLSEDHSVVGILLRTGEIGQEEADRHPARGQLTRYIGMLDEVNPYQCNVTLKPGDRLLLCSDGLTGLVDDAAIARLLRDNKEPQATCKALVAAANSAGGHDNVTVVIVDWLGSHGCNLTK